MWYPTFTDWYNQQQQMSGAFSQFVESEYPNLTAQFQYNLGHQAGYPSEEEALTGAQNI